jgi:hypothetical protein
MDRIVNTYNAVEVVVEGGYNLNVSDLTSGIYFITSIDMNGRKSQKQMIFKKWQITKFKM